MVLFLNAVSVNFHAYFPLWEVWRRLILEGGELNHRVHSHHLTLSLLLILAWLVQELHLPSSKVYQPLPAQQL